jgi:hypothetical protein
MRIGHLHCGMLQFIAAAKWLPEKIPEYVPPFFCPAVIVSANSFQLNFYCSLFLCNKTF